MAQYRNLFSHVCQFHIRLTFFALSLATSAAASHSTCLDCTHHGLYLLQLQAAAVSNQSVLVETGPGAHDDDITVDAPCLSNTSVKHGRAVVHNGTVASEPPRKASALQRNAKPEEKPQHAGGEQDRALVDKPEVVRVDPSLKSPLDMSPEERAKYDKPPSTTVKSVIALSFFSLWQYASIALARSIDELRGLKLSSGWSEIFQAASRGIHYPPMMACLFVATRMHTLASTSGLGESQVWTQEWMAACTESQYLQYAIVLTLAFVTLREKGDPPLTHDTGGIEDVHPRLGHMRYKYWFMKYLLLGLIAVAVFFTYAGIAGVMYGQWTYSGGGASQEKPSPAFVATNVLTTMYCCAYLFVWHENARPRPVDEGIAILKNPKKGEEFDKTQQAALSAVRAVHKAPMLAVLFLTARLRAMQLDPWNGKPQHWVRMSFYACCGGMLCEALVGAIIGYTGKEDPGYRTTHIFRSHWSLHVLLQLFNLCAALGLWSVYVSLMTMVRPDGTTKPFPPTLHCILWLSIVYFLVHGFQYLFFFVKHVLNWDYRLMQNTALAAQASVNFNPMLCILFLSVRLHAVQVTNFTGSPQDWAQDMMYLCVFAVFIQLATGVALPFLSGNKANFDDTGNTNYDLGPTWAMYVVSALKYFVIWSLMLGMGVVCYSALIIRPETANYGPPNNIFTTIKQMGWCVVIILAAMFLTSAKVVGHIVKVGVEQLSVGGMSFSIDSAAISVSRGYLNLKGITVSNPPAPAGVEFRTPTEGASMIDIDNIVVKLATWTMVTSCFRKIEIEYVAISGVHLKAAKSSCGGTSNLSTMMANLKGKEEKKPNPLKQCVGGVSQTVFSQRCGAAGSSKKGNAQSVESANKETSDDHGGKTAEPKPAAAEVVKADTQEKNGGKENKKSSGVILHVLDIRKISATMFLNGAPVVVVQLKDLKVDDFAKEKVGLEQIVSLILTTLVKSIFASGGTILKGLWNKACARPVDASSAAGQEEEEVLHE